MPNCVTLYDHAARFGNGEEAYRKIIEMQTKTNKILDVLPFKACNNGTTEKTVIRTALPDVAWRLINRGVKPSKSASKQVSFTTGHLQALAKVDEELIDLNGGANSETGAAFRMSENQAFTEKMNQEMATTLIYGDEKVNPAGFTGLSAYYYTTNDRKVDKAYAERVINAGGAGDALTSIWFGVYGENTIHGLFPKGTHAGFGYKDNGKVKVYDALGGEYYAYESQYDWRMGLAVKDPRYACRIANINTAALPTTQAAADAFIEKMIMAYNRLENVDMGKAAIFCNRDIMDYLEIAAMRATNVRLTIDEFAGKKILHFRGIPILRVDAILSNETAVV